MQSYKKGEGIADRRYDPIDNAKGHGPMLVAGNQVLVEEVDFFYVCACAGC